MKGQKRNTILDRTRPRIKTHAIGVIAQQGTYGKWTTVVQKDIVKVCTINVGTMKGKSREIVEMLARKRVDICCVQETQYKGEGCAAFGEGKEGYRFQWIGERWSRDTDKRRVEEGNCGGKKNNH